MPVFRPAALALILSFAAAPAFAQKDEPSADEPIATVNGTPISYSDVALADEEMGAALARLEPDVRFQYLLGMLIDRRVVALAAKEKHVDDDPQVKRRQDYFNEKALRDVYWVQLMQDKVTDEAAKAYYEKNIAGAPAEQEAHARHILVQDKAKAAEIAAEIEGGKGFEEAAKEYSQDPGSADGGDLGWFKRDEMVPEFGEAVFSMKPGEVSAPVQTQFGWHLIQLVELRDVPKPTYEEAHEEIIRQLARQEGQKLMEKLRTDAKIEIIGAESAAAPSGGRPQIVPAE
ncbi:PpiC-type peptidyl-prolyl cis-trans isomerase [Parvibaculum lavamentivorans DS-1]|uniref:Parvulin-like PPIase n=1 Tax=Parvibaculum lavamentivorans (strain DS-1 / DSM 13023 / NCIMB 13966) TaxID=402881 RepID=A7HTW7_PARL1|nr:peptidylprolyl isomerase [Parvibaculum lavamentivorans]ABS63350.1 PpiC-type peptidyl-prolyl cis-trans isomerase [Parvibaculum lavamentivorans DS-1]